MSYFSITAVHTLAEPCLVFSQVPQTYLWTYANIVEKEFRIAKGDYDARHARGQWFESTTAHHPSPLVRYLSSRTCPPATAYWSP